MKKYMFYMEVEQLDGSIQVMEWTRLTKREAEVMYQATVANLDGDFSRNCGWEEMSDV